MQNFKLSFFLSLILIVSACGGENPLDPDTDTDDSDSGTSNQSPTAEATANSNTVDAGDQITLDASGSTDPDGDDLTFEWSLSTPDGSSASLSDSQAEQPTFTTDMAGDYVASLSVNDGNGETDEDQVTVTAESGVVKISNDISTDETWTSDNIYQVTAAIEVNSSATLTIEAGTTVEFSANAGIRVYSDNAALVANGTETDSVRFTGVEKSVGFWRGLAIDSNNPGNKLTYTVVEYGGYENWGYISHAANVSVRNDSRLELTHSTLRHGKSFGLYVEPGSTLPNFANNTFTQNETAAGIPTTLMGAPDGASSYTGNTNDYVVVEEQDVAEDMTISALDVPYQIENTPYIESDAQVTVNAGVTMEFKANSGIRVYSDDAALIVEGTQNNHVLFTGTEKSVGFWRGLAIDSSHPNNKIDHAIVEYGGFESWGYIEGAGNVSVRNGSRLQLSNSTLRHSKSFGLYVEGGSDLPNFSSNLFTSNDVAAAIPTTLMGAPDAGSDYMGNTNDYVLVEEQDVAEDMTISALNVPYRVENTPNIEGDAQVTVKAGVTMEFKANTGIRVYSDNAALIAEGESGNPILFTGVDQSPGFWRGLAIDSSHPNNKLDNVIVEYGGYEAWAYINEAANVSIRDGSQLTITNSIIRNSGAYGGWADDGTGAVSYSGNSYSNNPSGDNNYGDPGN